MIRPLTLTNSFFANGSGHSAKSVASRHEISDYLYLVADCLTVVFRESASLGLSDMDMMETANRYLEEARLSCASISWVDGSTGFPARLGTPDEIPVAVTELSRRARLLEDAGFLESLS